MPQMAPMSWILIYLFLTLTLTTLMSKFYFLPPMKPNNMKKFPKTFFKALLLKW